MKELTDWDRLPKFLMGDDGGKRFFVVHCHHPRFIMEFDDDGTGTPLWIDSESDFIQSELAAGREPARTGAKLMREAVDFYAAEIERE